MSEPEMPVLNDDLFRTYIRRCPDILACIISHSALPEVVAIASVSKELRWLVQYDLRLRFIELLKPYVDNVTEAARVLRRTRTAISGSQALQFMDPSNSAWKNTAKDIDLYITEEDFLILLAFFVNSQGYSIFYSSHPSLQDAEQVEPEDLDDEELDSGTFDFHTPSGIRSVTQLRKGDLRIDIIVSRDPFSSTTPIFAFHSTIVMNFLTPDAVFCAYPLWTFKKRGLVNTAQKVRDRVLAALQKYVDRGYSIAWKPSKWDKSHKHICPTGACRGNRTTIDKKCLYFPFDSAAGHDQSVAFDYYRNILGGRIQWSLGGDPCRRNENEIFHPRAFVQSF